MVGCLSVNSAQGPDHSQHINAMIKTIPWGFRWREMLENRTYAPDFRVRNSAGQEARSADGAEPGYR
jgi:hypothetical protein